MENRKNKNKMKKVMMALAITALAGVAFADVCGECCEVKCTFGYRLKVMVRTTGSCSVTKQNACNECSTGTYRGPVIRRFMGLVYGQTGTTSGQCGETGCGCNEWKDNAFIAFYDYDNATPMSLDADMTELIQLNRIGCFAADRQKAEMAFTVGYKCKEDAANVAQMTFAGFGLCGNHDGNITIGAVSGYCAGQLPAGGSYTTGPCQDPQQICTTLAWNICCNTAYECAYTAAYGKWTLVWDSSIASKVGSNLTIDKSAPVAKTGWGEAKAVLLADKRACKDIECQKCSE